MCVETSHETCVEWLASQLRSTSQFSQDSQVVERSREQENPDILRGALRPTEIKPNAPAPLVSVRTQLEPKEMTTGVGDQVGVRPILGRYEQLDLGRSPSGSVSATTGITPPTLTGLCGRPNELEKCEENCETSHGACERMVADQFLSCLSPSPNPGSLHHSGGEGGVLT